MLLVTHHIIAILPLTSRHHTPPFQLHYLSSKTMFRTTIATILFAASGVQADYLMVRSYVEKNCSGSIMYQMSTAVDLCQRNSYQPGTYRIECSDDNTVCTTEAYSTSDCSGTSETTKKYDASGQCVDPSTGMFATFKIVADDDAKQGFSTPLLSQWQDENCVGTAVEFIDEGICHGDGQNSYRAACVNGTVQSCQWTESADCSGDHSLCVPTPGTAVGSCKARGMLGGKASVQYSC